MDVEYVGTMFAQGNTLTPSEAPRKRSHQADSSNSDQSDSGMHSAKKKGQLEKQKKLAMEKGENELKKIRLNFVGSMAQPIHHSNTLCGQK